MKSIVQAGLLAASLVTALCASAQTTAIGPYYATPSWDQKLPAASRFVVLSNWDSKAVLDRETGLVWERDPTNARNLAYLTTSYANAISLCAQTETGGRKGWRVPSLSELQSLFDRDGASSGLLLPIGHPFLNVQTLAYWSTTTYPEQPTSAYVQSFNPRGSMVTSGTSFELGMWCVRGPGSNF